MHAFSRLALAALLIFAMVPVAQAQDPANEYDLVGTWEVDTLAMADIPPIDSPAPAPVPTLVTEPALIEITFNADHTMATATDVAGSDMGTWAVISAEGNTLVLEGTGPDGSTQSITVAFNSSSSITVTPTDGEAVILNRVGGGAVLDQGLRDPGVAR